MDSQCVPGTDLMKAEDYRQNFDAGPVVLVVEDSPVNQKIAEFVLTALHVRVKVASDGMEALRLLEGQSFSAVLMDCQMPVLDGLTTSRIIRADEQVTGEHVPIIAVTAHASREECLEAGMDDHIQKPLTTASAIRKLRFWLNLNESSCEERAS